MIDKILKLGIKAVCVSWALWVLLDYLAFHPYITKLLGDHPYASLFVILGIGAAGLGYLSSRKLKKQREEALGFHYRGIALFLAAQLAVVLLLALYLSQNPLPGLPSASRSLYFLIYGNGYFLMLSLLVIAAHNIGDFLLSPLKNSSLTGRNVLAVALGFSLIGTLGAMLGLFDLLHPYVLWPLLLIPVGLRWRASLSFLKEVVWEKKRIPLRKWWTPAVVMIMLLVIAYYWLAAFKNIPIGYDGSGLYVNLARLVADTNGLPAGGQAFAWSLVMGMGDVLFNNQIMSILLSHVMSIFCLFAIYQVARKFLSFDFALLATLLSGVAPYFAFHGIVDEKVDLALTFVVLSSLLLLFQLAPLFHPTKEEEIEAADRKTVAAIQFGSRFSISALTYGMLLVGWLLGFAFSIKYTAIFALFAIGGWWFYLRGGRLAFGAAFSLILGLVLGLGIYRFGYLSITATEANLAGGGFMLLGAGLFVLAFRKRTQLLLPAFSIFPAMGLAFLLAFSPWAVKHLSENDSFGVNSLLEGKAQSPEIQLKFDFELSLLPEWNLRGKRDFWSDDPRTDNQRYRGEYYNFGEMTQATGGQADGFNTTLEGFNEEISRYAGFEAVFWRFHSLPYDLTINNNVRNGRYLNIGFYFLLLLPLLIMLPGRYSRKRAGLSLLLFFGALLYVAMVYLSIYAPADGAIDYVALSSAVENNLTDPSGDKPWWAGIYLFFAAPFVYLATLSVPLYQSLAQAGTVATILSMLLLTTLGFLVVRQRLGDLPQSFKAFGALLLTYGFFWWLMGNAIIWYAMPLFVLFPIFLLHWLEKPEDFLGPQETVFSRYFLGTITTLMVVVSTCVHFSSPFPTDDGGAALLRYPFVDYMTNPSAREVDVLKAYNPVLDDLQRSVNADPEGKVYRVNTHYGYLIENNDTRVFSDPVLERYASVTEQLDDDANFFKLLKQQGFAYILLDLKMGSQDRTPEQALRNKFVSLAKQLMQSEDVQLMVTDNYIADPQAPAVRLRSGQFANARYGLAGQTVQLGNLALFKLR